MLTVLDDLASIGGGSVANIYGNGHNVTYDSTLAGNSTLAGMTYLLQNGGHLLPR